MRRTNLLTKFGVHSRAARIARAYEIATWRCSSRPSGCNAALTGRPRRRHTPTGCGGSFRPPLPRALGPHRSWTGTFGGHAKLRKGQAFSIGFGLFELESAASGGATVFWWITNRSFTL